MLDFHSFYSRYFNILILLFKPLFIYFFLKELFPIFHLFLSFYAQLVCVGVERVAMSGRPGNPFCRPQTGTHKRPTPPLFLGGCCSEVGRACALSALFFVEGKCGMARGSALGGYLGDLTVLSLEFIRIKKGPVFVYYPNKP